MTFWDHLDDLRKALTYPFLTLLVLTVVAFLLKDQGLAAGGQSRQDYHNPK